MNSKDLKARKEALYELKTWGMMAQEECPTYAHVDYLRELARAGAVKWEKGVYRVKDASKLPQEA